MANLTPTDSSKSSNFITLTGNKVNEMFTDFLKNRTEIYAWLTKLRNFQRSPYSSPPSNPNVGDRWECSSTGGGYTADTMYRWSGTAWTEIITSSIDLPMRNCVLEGPVDSSGTPILYAAGTGLACNLEATDKVRLSFANGYSDTSGAVNFYHVLSADVASFWSNLPQSSTVYLYIDRDANGNITGGYSTMPLYSQSYAPAHSSGKHWYDTNHAVMYASNGSAWAQVWRIFVGTATTSTNAVTSVTVCPYLTISSDVWSLLWSEKMYVSIPTSGAVGPLVNKITRNCLLKNVYLSPAQGKTPASSTTVNLFHYNGNTLNGSLTNSATSATLASSITLKNQTLLLVDEEAVLITAIGGQNLPASGGSTDYSGTALTITRAQQATTAAAHDSGVKAFLWVCSGAMSSKAEVTVASSAFRTAADYSMSAGDLVTTQVNGAGLASMGVLVMLEEANR